eukprot:XP_011450650.1 PREDICTED: receptor-type tyrosine-protein phosphatase kappa-like [Crassostrea gigas]
MKKFQDCLPSQNSFSYQKDRAFIVTHYPTPEDAVDFLRLLNDHESDTVVCMNPLHETESSKTWLPEIASSRDVPPFVVQHESESDTEVKVTTVNIIHGEKTPHSVVVVEPKGQLKSTGTHPDTSFLRSIVSFTRNLSTENPITIVSKDGASLCGVFCAVFNSIQQITMDNNIDVFTTVRQLQTRRPEFCSTQNVLGQIFRKIVSTRRPAPPRRSESVPRNLQAASQRHISDMLSSIRKSDKRADKQPSTMQDHSRSPRKSMRTNRRKNAGYKNTDVNSLGEKPLGTDYDSG